MTASFETKVPESELLGGEDSPPLRRTRCVLQTLLAVTLVVPFALVPPFVCAGQEKHQHKADMPGMQMSGEEDMRDMGPSMAAMAGHMYITPLRQRQPGDEEKAKAVVAALK